MAMNERPESQERPGSLFVQPWWLDAVAPGHWSEVRVERGGELYARMPYVWEKRRGSTRLTMPPLTQTLGPWVRDTGAKYPNRLAEEKELMSALIDGLPPHAAFIQNFHYGVTNWLPFYWRGFQQTTRYTYVIPSLADLDAVWEGMRDKTRCDIKKAKEGVAVRDDLGLDRFLELNEGVFKKQRLEAPYGRELVRRLDEACGSRGCRKILFAQDGQGRVHAVLYLVWNPESAYYLMGGVNPEFRGSGAGSLLLWEAIRFAATVSKRFDFEGSMIESVERHFRSFGGLQIPYFQVSKINSLALRALRDVKSWFSKKH